MKTINITIISLVMAVTGFSQTWQWVNPLPQGNTLNDIKFIDNNTGYAVGQAGTIIKTTNGGLEWSFCNSLKYGEFGKMTVVNTNVIYVTTKGNFYIWKSTDAGLTWNSYSTYFGPVSVFFADANTGYIGCGSCLMRKTTDGGISWNTCNLIQANTHDVNALYFFNANTGFACAGTTIQKTTNGGSSWSVVYKDNLTFSFGCILFIDNTTGYIGGSGGSIRKTTDGGNNWFVLNSGSVTNFNTLLSTGQDNLIAGGQYGANYYSEIIKSTNGGATFYHVYTDTVYSINSISNASNSMVYACGSKGGLLKSFDGGNSWARMSSGIYNDMGKVFFMNSQTGFIPLYNSTILKTTNSGLNWFLVNTGLDIIITRIFSPGSNICYAGGRSGRIIKSTNAGDNWTDLGALSTFDIISMYFVNSFTGYVGFNNVFNIYHTSNGGLNWNLQTIQPVQGEISNICFVNSNTGFAATGIGDIAKTTNGGINWSLNFHTGSDYLRGLNFPDENTGYALNHFLSKTTNCGNSWFVIDTLTGGLGGWGLSFKDPNHGFIGDYTNGAPSSYPVIRKTTNGGLTWISEYPGFVLPNGMFATNADTCFITGYSGAILAYKSGIVNIEKISNSIPKQFSLFQNYPNPFNPKTVIRFQVASDKFVILKVIDVLGKEVATLVSQQLKPGTYEVDWNGTNYPSGVYFYQLSIGNELLSTKKMVLIK